MIKAYMSGDVYFYFAKAAGAVPQDAKKEDHKSIRNLFKSTVLGLSYGMRSKSLALKLTQDMGEVISENRAQELIDMFEEVFWVYTDWKEEISDLYNTQGYLVLKDGWYLWGDNDNWLSVKNFPSQGMGSVIMRRAVKLCQEAGLKVIFSLHDALYIQESDINKISIFRDCMWKAFADSFDNVPEANVGLDIYAWSPSMFPKEENITVGDLSLDVMPIYIDERSEAEYKKYSKYFWADELAL